MLSLNLLKRSRKSIVSSPVPRADGYSAQAARIVALFQAYIEREVDCDYEALRLALVWARSTEFPITLYTLRAAYNDARYSAGGVASRTH